MSESPTELPQLLERYRRGTDLIEEAVAGARAGEIDFKPSPEKWSIRQIVNHLADTEAVTVCRFRSILAEDNPTLYPFDQDLWASRTDSETRDIERALRTMRVLRDDNYELLKALPPGAFSRIGTHASRGEMTLFRWLEIFTMHVEKHAGQIENNRSAFHSSQSN